MGITAGLDTPQQTAVLAVLGYRIVSYGLPRLPRALACLHLQVSPTGGEEPKPPRSAGWLR